MKGSSSNFPNRSARGFTLAELLAVIIIMSILMVFVVPSVVGMTRGASMRGATMQVRSTLMAARQIAITRRATASVLFPQTLSSPNDSKNYRAIAIFTNGTTAANGALVSAWDFLPQGIVFQATNSLTTVNAAVDKTTSAPVPALTFNRLGDLSGGNEASVCLLEGVIMSGSVQPKGAAGGTNKITVLFPAGIIQVKRL